MPEQMFIVRRPIKVGKAVLYAAGAGEEPVRVNAYGWNNLDLLLEQGYLIPDTTVAAPPPETPVDPLKPAEKATDPPAGADAKGGKAKK